MPGAEHLNAHSQQLSASSSCFIIHLKQEGGNKQEVKQQEDTKSKAHLSGDYVRESRRGQMSVYVSMSVLKMSLCNYITAQEPRYSFTSLLNDTVLNIH